MVQVFFFLEYPIYWDILFGGSWIRQASFPWGFSIKEVHPLPSVYGKVASSGNVVSLR